MIMMITMITPIIIETNTIMIEIVMMIIALMIMIMITKLRPYKQISIYKCSSQGSPRFTPK